MSIGIVGPAGQIGLTVIRNGPVQISQEEVELFGSPAGTDQPEAREWRARNWAKLRTDFRRIRLAQRLQLPHFYGLLWIRVLRRSGEEIDYGLASCRVVTDAGVGFIVDAFQNLKELENMKYHGIGTGGTAEAAGQTALVTESTTALNPDSTRATGTTTEAAANIYQTVGTLTVDATVAVTEHGVFDQAATGGGVMLDRSLFSTVNLASGDSIQTDYRLTFASGG